MRKDHVYYLDTLRALIIFFDNYADVAESSPLLKEDVTGFRLLVGQIEKEVNPKNSVITFTAADKKKLRDRLTQNVLSALAKITAQAVKDKNSELVEASNTKPSAFTKCNDSDFLDLVRGQVEHILAYPAILEKYGLKKDFQANLSEDFTALETMKAKMSVEQTKSIVATGVRQDIFKDVKLYVDVVLTESIKNVAAEYPTMAKEYEGVKTGQTPSVSPTRLGLLVLDDATSAPWAKADVVCEELKLTAQTDEKGKLYIKTGAKKQITFIVSGEGMVTQEITIAKLTRGQTLDLEVRLKAVAVATQGQDNKKM